MLFLFILRRFTEHFPCIVFLVCVEFIQIVHKLDDLGVSRILIHYLGLLNKEWIMLRAKLKQNGPRKLALSAPISYPEPSSFLLRMLDENEGLWKGLVLKVYRSK